MSKGDARQEVKPQTIEATSPILIDSTALGRKDCLHILHVDDDVCLLEVSKQILLVENNFEIEDVTSVDEAFEKMENQTYDAIVSDYEMPLKNGLEFLKELRAQKSGIPFILFTGKGREDVVVKALNLGADSYINKNGSPETVYCELADAINKTVERKKSREQLARSESKYRALVENSLQGISILLAAPLRIVFANGTFGKLLGYSSQELMSLSPEEIMSLVYHEDRAVFFKHVENRLLGESAEFCFEFRGVRKDGSLIWLSSLANRVDYDGQPAVQGMFLDVNESKIAAEILRESEQRYRELANCLPNIVFETDLNGQLEFANERAAEISGHSLNEIEKGLNILQFIVPEDREKAMKNLQRLLSGEIDVPAEYTFVRKNGTTFPALITATPRICKNKVTGFRGIVLDISEQKKSEAVTKKSESRYRELSNFLPEIVFETDLTGKITFFNQRAFEITGFTPEDLGKGMNMLSFVVPEERERAMQNTKKTLEREEHSASEYRLFRKNGAIYPAIVRTAPIISENKVIGLRGIAIDITERQKAEEVLRENEESFRSLIDSMDDLIFVLGFDGIFKNYHQPSDNKKLYAPPEEFIGKHFLNVLPPEVAELCQAAMNRIEDSGETQEFDYFMEMNGEKSWFNARLSPATDKLGRKTSVTVVVRNITERKKAEQAVSASLRRYQSFIEVTGELGWITNAAGEVLEDIPSFRKLTGQTYDEVKGWGWTRAVHPEDVEHATRAWQAAVAAKTKYEVEYRLRRCDGVYRNFIARGAPILNEDGKIREWVGTCIDITDRNEAEGALNRAMDELVRVNEKLGVVGSLTRHDVRNKLLAVTGNAFLLKKKHPDQADITDGLRKMEQSCKEIGEILEFAKMYEQLGVEELTYISVEESLNEALALFSGSLTVKVMNDCRGLTLLADSFVRQLFFNLIDNSMKHGKKATTIKVSYEEDQDGLNLIYEDDGIGISVDNKPKLFKSGFSTGGSSGYGLYLIRKMIEVYGWAIQENGEPDKGAKFTITIPKISQKGKENFKIAQ